MELRFFIEPSAREPHSHRHDVTEEEVEDVVTRPLEDRPGAEGARVALARARERASRFREQ